MREVSEGVEYLKFFIIFDYEQVHLYTEKRNKKLTHDKPLFFEQKIPFKSRKDREFDIYSHKIFTHVSGADEKKEVEQFFMINTKNDIELIYPQYESRIEKFRIKNEIREAYEFGIIDSQEIKIHFKDENHDSGMEFNGKQCVVRHKKNVM